MESSGRLTSTCSHHLGDTDTLPLTATYASNELVSDKDIVGMGDIKHSEKEILHLIDEITLGYVRKSLPGSLGG